MIKSEKQKIHLKRLTILNTGKKHSEERKEKIRQKAVGRKHSKESNKKKGNWSRGKTYKEIYGNKSDLEKKKRSEAHKGRPKSLEARKKISGKNHYNWKGGISPLVMKIRSCIKYHKWRLNVYQRDSYTCVNCHQIGSKLEAHHVKSFADIINENKVDTMNKALNCKELWNIDNGITLCKNCHKLTDSYKNKKS